MGSIITRTEKLRKLRQTSQALFLVFFNLNLFIPGSILSLRGICGPVFNCHGCSAVSIMACPIGVIVNFVTLRIVPFITLGILGIVGVIGGRFICGWMCPFGFLQDLLHKIPTRKFSAPRALNFTKYALLAVMALAIPFLWPGKPWTFCDVCPAGTLESMIPWSFMGIFGGFTPRFYMKISILIAVLVLAVLVSRGFCRMFCPLGAIFSLFNRFSLFRFGLKHKKCNCCGICAKMCPTDIDPVVDMNKEECIRCLDCTTTKHINLGVK